MEAEMDRAADEIRRLKACINDLISVQALPAIWSGGEASQIVSTLLEVLLEMLDLDFVYARLQNSGGRCIETVRITRSQHVTIQPQDIGQALNSWLENDLHASALFVRNPIGDGDVSITRLRLGLLDPIGVVVAASGRANFPTATERLLLSVAANQAAIGLHEVRRLSEQTRVARELDQQVAQQTRELVAVNEELKKEITERKRAEEAVRAAKARFEGVLEIAQDAIISVDSNQRIMLFNQGAEKVFGFTQVEVIGCPLDLLLPQHVGDVHRKHIEEFARLPEVARTMGQRREVSGRRKDGSEFPAEASISKLDLDGELVFTVILRDITKRRRAELRLNTQYAITRILSDSASIDEAAPRIVQSICECLDWKVGEIWRVDGETKLVTFVKAWHLPSGDFAEFASASLPFSFPPGVGLPGRVCESRKPLWIRNLAEDSNFLRASLATKAGLHCGFGFPILLGEETLGAMLFFSSEVREPDHDVLQMMANIGSQIGQFIERRRAEESLRKSEERFRWMADATPEVIWFTALEPEKVLYVSPSFERIWGLPVENLYRNPRLWTETIVPEDRDRVITTFARWIAGEKVNYQDIEYRILQPNGAIRWIHERGVLRRDDQGKPFLASGISTDITERKRAEEELRRSEAYLAEAQRLSLTGSFGWEVSSGELFWSQETLCILGYDPETKPTLELVFQRVHPDDLVFVRQTFDHASREGTDLDFEHRLLMPDSSVKHLHVMAHAVRNDFGTLEFVGAVSDVTATKLAQERIHQSEGELRRIVDVIPQIIIVIGPDGNPLYANRAALDYIGVSPDQVPCMGFGSQLSHPDDAEKFRTVRQESLARGVPFQLEQRMLGKHGGFRWFLFQYNPLLDEHGAVARWYVTATDIDERKRAEDRIHNENLALREEIDRASMFEEIVGSSKAIRKVLQQVKRVAPTDSTVLILGETGTGKELIARAIHKRSSRSARAFIRVNCSAIPSSLIASELFGHEKGAFTGASQRRLGRFESANGGTILLDEIGELPSEAQKALLRVLQEREIERVGSSQPISVDVRVLAATNRDLKAAVDAGTFRRDLFYRLNVFPIQMPPLRERPDDIPLLVEYLIERYGKKAGKHFAKIPKATLELFQAYDWPGNIRELQNVIERAVILCDGDTFSVDESWLRRESSQVFRPAGPLLATLAEREKEIIETALADSRGRISGPSGAAAKLRIPRQTLESKIKALGIDKYRFHSRRAD